MHEPDLRRQMGCENEALFPSVASVQVAMASPISSNPVLQVYVAVSPAELPVNVTPPLLGLLGLEHRAMNIKEHQLTIIGIKNRLL